MKRWSCVSGVIAVLGGVMILTCGCDGESGRRRAESGGDAQIGEETRSTDLPVPERLRNQEPPAAEVQWVDVTDQFGGAFADLRSVHEWTAPNDADVELAMLTDGGALLERVLPGGAVSGRNALPSGTGRGAKELQVGDLDNDGFADLLVIGTDHLELWLGREDGRFQPAPRALPGRLPVRRVEFWDFDQDGDLDLVALADDPTQRRTDPAAGPLVWFRNNGDRTFEAPVSVGLEGLVAGEPVTKRPGEDVARARISTLDAVDFALHDLDQDGHIDVVVTGRRGTVALMNLGNGEFRPMFLGAVGPLSLVRLEDLNNDGAPDLFGVGGEEAGAQKGAPATDGAGRSTRWIAALGADRAGRVADLRLSRLIAGSLSLDVRDLALEDVDNDGDVDVLYVGGDGLGCLRNVGGGSFELLTGSDVGAQAAPFSLDVADADDDGMVEAWIGTNLGSRVIEVENSRGYGAWRVRPKGTRDNRDAVGLVVQQSAGTSFQSRILRGARGLRLGLAERTPEQIDSLRLRWPGGIVQSRKAGEFVLSTPREFRPAQE